MAKSSGGSSTKSGKSGDRDSRLAAALRANLRRRKAQARGRAVPAKAGTDAPEKGGR